MTKLASACLSVLCLCVSGAQVYKADLNKLDLDSGPKVVTNVTFEGLATEQNISDAIEAAIATNNPAFVSAVTNCPVSLPLDSDPSLAGWGTYGTLGALLAAIIAGVANLNSNKADKAETLEGYGVTDAKIENGTITLGNGEITPITQLPTATDQSLGMVTPDGTTITVDANGVISAKGGGGGLWTGGNLTFSLRIHNGYPEDATGYLLLIHNDGSTQKVTWNGSNLGPSTYQDVSLAWLFPTGGLDGGGASEGGLVTFTTGGSSVAGALMRFDGMTSPYSNVFPIPCAFVLDGDATLAVDVYTSCLIEGTAILLADGSSKPVEDIGYDDELAVWDFDEGRMSSAKPCWIKKPQRIGHAWRNRFSDGTEVWTTGTAAGHRFFSLDAGRFLYNTDCVGHRVYKFDGSIVTLESATLEHGDYEFYNLITAFHGNCFAGGILAGYRYCNLYPIAGMKYVKDGRRLRSPEDYPSVSKEMFDGCRLSEVQDNPEDVARYIIDTKESVRL